MKTAQDKGHRSASMITAVHEAGHALMAWLDDHPIRERGVTLSEDRQSGNTHVRAVICPREARDPSSLPYRDMRIEKELEICLAGPIAESIFTGVRLNGLIQGFDGPHGDNTIVNALVNAAYGEGHIELFQMDVQRRVSRKFRDNRTWATLMRLAEELHESRHLSAKRVHEIALGSGLRQRRPWTHS